jgi:HEAT repeat protein
MALRGLKVVSPARAEREALRTLATKKADSLLRVAALDVLKGSRSDAVLGALMDLLTRDKRSLPELRWTLETVQHPKLLPALLQARDVVLQKETQRLGIILYTLTRRGWLKGLRAVLELLESSSVTVRACAAVSLDWFPADGAIRRLLPELTAALTNPDSQGVEQVLKLLARIGPEAGGAVPGVLDVLKSNRITLRQAAIKTLGQIRNPAELVVPALTAALTDPSQKVRCDALHALRAVGPGAAVSVPRILELVREPEPREVRLGATSALGPIRVTTPAVITALSALLNGDAEAVAREAGCALAQLGQPGAAVLVKAMKSSNGKVRHHAAIAVRVMTSPEEAVIADLVEAARPDLAIASTLAASLVCFGPAAVPAIPMLLGLAASPDRWHRFHAARTLGTIGKAARTAVPTLQSLLADRHDDVRGAAGEALAAVAPGTEGLAALCRLLTDREDWVRRSAARALGEHCRSATTAITALTQAREDDSLAVRAEATKALNLIRGETARPRKR